MNRADIAVAHAGRRELVQEMAYSARHGIDVTRCARDRLREHVAIGIEHAGRHVAGLARGSGKTGSDQGE